MKIDSCFLEDEVRDGFFVSASLKCAWANELMLLHDLDSICRENNISYFVDWGSLLGAIRHKGFIPWDDDVDIVMHRNELERFRKIVEEKYNSEYCFIDFDNNDNHWKFLVAFAFKDKMCFEPEYLEKHYNFPYLSSLDIFVMDNVSDDQVEEEARCKRIRLALNAAELVAQKKTVGKERILLLDKIKMECGLSLPTHLEDLEFRRELFRYIREQMKLFNDRETEKIAQMIPWGIRGARYYPNHFFSHKKRVPFEMIETYVPCNANQLLEQKYGNYMEMRRGLGIHEYPFFETQKKSLEGNVEYQVGYRYKESKVFLRDTCSLKELAVDYLSYLQEFSETITVLERELSSGCSWNNLEKDVAELFADVQETTLDFGTLVENVKGNVAGIVTLFETLCEELYLSLENQFIKANDMNAVVDKLANSIQTYIIQKKEVVFIAYKPLFWEVLQDFYNKYLDDDLYDVYVIPTKYGYKKYDGTVRKWVCEEEYPEKVILTNAEDYNFALHCPDVVFMQFPYDEYHLGVKIDSKLYAANIRPFTNEIICVPYLNPYDFKENDLAQIYNLSRLWQTPGCALADKIVLPTKGLRERFVNIMTSWAGEETREQWERKLLFENDN